MAVLLAGQTVHLREIILRDKPEAMIAASPKATVPVLVLDDGTVLEESLDIALWALAENDPQDWLPHKGTNREAMLSLIERVDGSFKHHLDRAKYATRYGSEWEDGETETEFAARHRMAAVGHLQPLETRLTNTAFLWGGAPTLADIATFPFIRQFANSDPGFWDRQPLPRLKAWLQDWTSSALFKGVMEKYPLWKDTGKEVSFPSAP